MRDFILKFRSVLLLFIFRFSPVVVIRITSDYKNVKQITYRTVNQEQKRGRSSMAIIRWNPYSEIESIRRQFDKMFDDATGLTPSFNNIWKPAVELQDNGENLTLKAELPGIEAKDLDISVTRNAVVIRGENRSENQTENKGFFHSEFRYGKFERAIGLPVEVQNDKVEANFTNGVLTLTLPKTETAKNRVVKLNLAGTQTNHTVRAEQTEAK